MEQVYDYFLHQHADQVARRRALHSDAYNVAAHGGPCGYRDNGIGDGKGSATRYFLDRKTQHPYDQLLRSGNQSKASTLRFVNTLRTPMYQLTAMAGDQEMLKIDHHPTSSSAPEKKKPSTSQPQRTSSKSSSPPAAENPVGTNARRSIVSRAPSPKPVEGTTAENKNAAKPRLDAGLSQVILRRRREGWVKSTTKREVPQGGWGDDPLLLILKDSLEKRQRSLARQQQQAKGRHHSPNRTRARSAGRT
jgi:hypothetical protein